MTPTRASLLLVFALSTLLGTLASAPLRGTEDAAPSDPCRAGAPALDGRLDLAFPESRASRTRVEATLTLAPTGATDPLLYRLDGEVLRGELRVEGFRYELRPPASGAAPRLTFVRSLSPGHYRLLLRLAESESGRCLTFEREVDVPGSAGAGPAGGAADGGDDETEPGATVRLYVPADRPLTGKVRFDADVRDAGVASVGFELDGRRVMTRSRPPWSVELDLGPKLRVRRLTVIAFAPGGAELARDEARVNGGPHRFAVRLALASAGQGAVEARAVVEVPEGERVDRVDFEVNDTLRATLFQPPYLLPLDTPGGSVPTWVKATAHLEGGGAAEVVRLLGAPGTSDGIEVDFVELYATVVDRSGSPVRDLKQGEVRILEDGRPQAIRRFQRVEDVPIHAAVMIDTSISMADDLRDAERAALRFFEQVLTERDRAAVFTFAEEPRLAVRFTASRERLAGGLVDMVARGHTKLYDSLIFALHYFSGLSGKRALILLSDGADSTSDASFDDALEFARRTGVTIYSIGLNVPGSPPEPGMVLDRLARETGGRSFRVERANRLGPIYEQIEREFREQYLLGYQSDAEAGDRYRLVEVEVLRPGIEVRAAAGYYP